MSARWGVVGGFVAFCHAACGAGVPVVGCAADGMSGPVAAPVPGAPAPVVAGAAAAGLAWYVADGGPGVLAPQGWHCAAVYGSGGAELFVTPPGHAARAFFDPALRLRGPVVVASLTNGETSGRFAVAQMIPRLFPAYRAWAAALQAGEPDLVFRPDPTPYAAIVARSTVVAEFMVKAGGVGLGATWRLVPNGDPVVGAAMLRPRDGMDVRTVMVRLPRSQRRVAQLIVRTFEVDAGMGRADRAIARTSLLCLGLTRAPRPSGPGSPWPG